jgi:ATP-dependent RNA helicase HelY
VADLPLPVVLTAGRQVRRLSAADFPVPVTVIDRVKIPTWFSPRSPKHRRDLAATVRTKVAGLEHRLARKTPPMGDGAAEEQEVTRLRAALRRHPCHDCPDREAHAREAESRARLAQEVERLEVAVAGRSHVIARTFERVCTVLQHLGYLDGDSVTPDGERLGDLYTELDLLAAECLRRGLWDGLDAAELAACVSALTFESRSPETGPVRLPGGRVRGVLMEMASVWGDLERVEKDNRLAFLREPDLGFAWATHAWARGKSLEQVLDTDLTPGDFVRAIKQTIDLLGQVAVAAGPGSPLRSTARSAADGLRRGVVAYSSVEDETDVEGASVGDFSVVEEP